MKSFPMRFETWFWWVASVALFVGAWEICWLVGLADPRLLPPPHMFLSNIMDNGRLFDRATRLGNPSNGQIITAMLYTIGISVARVAIGMAITLVLTLLMALAIAYNQTVRNLLNPIVYMLAPVSPIAWMPVALMLFGIGNVPVIFLIVISLIFMMTISTVSLIDKIPHRYFEVAQTMGASKNQIVSSVMIPAIIPGVLSVLRINLFIAWMMLLIAESVGVQNGLGLVVMTARRSFNSELAFLTMIIIGILGVLFDFLFGKIQARYFAWSLVSREK
ncbi:ABC transporter permease [Mesorhizobium sp. A623]